MEDLETLMDFSIASSVVEEEAVPVVWEEEASVSTWEAWEDKVDKVEEVVEDNNNNTTDIMEDFNKTPNNNRIKNCSKILLLKN